jgi:hypothetical protein
MHEGFPSYDMWDHHVGNKTLTDGSVDGWVGGGGVGGRGESMVGVRVGRRQPGQLLYMLMCSTAYNICPYMSFSNMFL